MYKDFYLMDNLSSYLTSGIGVAFGEVSAPVNLNGVDKAYDDATFAWQMGIGLGYDITENVLVDLGYRYLGISDFTFEKNTDVQFGSHNVMAGVRYSY
jgi:opacity protein-like surface antigen